MATFVRLFNKHEILEAIPGIISTNIEAEGKDLVIESVSIDSRSMGRNALFLCYKGKNHDGHDFIESAAKSGACCVMVEDFSEKTKNTIEACGIRFIYVTSTMEAMLSLARYKRNMMEKTKFIAITGSSGKTTVKNMISESIGRSFFVESSYKSYNNHFGVPLTILNIKPGCNIAVVEIGTNHVGEIEPLARLVSPDIAIITNIGRSHIGNFPNGISDIIKEKSAIFKALKPGGIAILNEANEFFKDVYKEVVSLGIKNIVRIGKPDSSHLYISKHSFSKYYTTDIEVSIKEGSSIKSTNCSLNGVAYHNTTNILFAFAIGRLFKLPLDSIASHINGTPVIEGRGNIEHISVDKKRITIINDTHNCSFEALKAGLGVIGVLKQQNPNRRVVCFLGDMAETGENTEYYHSEMSEHVAKSGADKVYCVGESMKHLFEKLPENLKGQHHAHVGQLIKHIRSSVQDQDICFFKGKRVLTMEKAIQKLCMS